MVMLQQSFRGTVTTVVDPRNLDWTKESHIFTLAVTSAHAPFASVQKVHLDGISPANLILPSPDRV